MDEGAGQEFAEFVAARSRQLIRLAYVLTGDQHAAEDLLQNALVKAAAHWGRIHTAPEAYVRRIMYREQVNWLRLRARRRETAMAQVPEAPVGDEAASVTARLALRDALLALPPRRRAVLVLRYLEDLPESQVAEIMGCSVGTVRSQCHRAVAQLRLARMHSPHNVLAMVIGGHILSHPVVIRAVTTRWVEFTGFPDRAAVEFALRSLLAG